MIEFAGYIQCRSASLRTIPACPATYHYRSRRPEQAALRKRIREIAETRMRYGYRRIRELLWREGCHVNAKQVHWKACICGLSRFAVSAVLISLFKTPDDDRLF
jgi:hypothetical protein